MITKNVMLLSKFKPIYQNVQFFQLLSKSDFNRNISSKKNGNKNLIIYKRKGEKFTKNKIIDISPKENEKKDSCEEFRKIERKWDLKETSVTPLCESESCPVKTCNKNVPETIDFPKFPSGLLDFNNIIKNPFSLFDVPIKGPDFQLLFKNLSHYAAVYSEKEMKILLDLEGFKEEDFQIRVEGVWLVIEAHSTESVSKEKGGGLIHREIFRRYEIPPNSDVSNITTTVMENKLKVVIPYLNPKIKRLPKEEDPPPCSGTDK